jgi:hypothetical protein
MKTIHIPAKKSSHIIRSAKDDLGLKLSRAYSIPCEWWKVNIGWTGQPTETWCKEHERRLFLYQPDKSAVAEHSIDSCHRIRFHKTEVLAQTSGYMDRLVKEAIEIKLHPDSISRLEGFKLSKVFNSSTNLLRHSNTHTSRKSLKETEKSMQK